MRLDSQLVLFAAVFAFLALLFLRLGLLLFVVVVRLLFFRLDHLVEALGVFLGKHSVAAEVVDQRTALLLVEVPFLDVGLVSLEQHLALSLELSNLSRWFVPQLLGNSQLNLHALVDETVQCLEGFRHSLGESGAVASLLMDVVLQNLLAHVIS